MNVCSIRFCGFRPILLTVLALTFLFRLPFLFTVANLPELALQPDSASYTEFAQQIADRGLFELEPNLGRPPGYPLFLTIVYCVSNTPLATAFVQILLSLVVAALVVWLAHKIASVNGWLQPLRAALIAGVLFATDSVSSAYTCLILSESLFTLLVTLEIAALLGWAHGAFHRIRYVSGSSGSVLWPALAGLIAGFNAMVRPIGILFALAQLPYFWLKRGSLPWVRCAALLLGVSCLLPAIWIVRNEQQVGVYAMTELNSMSLYYYRAVGVLAEVEEKPFGEVQQRVTGDFEEEARREGWGIEERIRQRMDRAWPILLGHPLVTAKITLKGLATMLLGPGNRLFKGFFGEGLRARVAIGWSFLHLAVVYGLLLFALVKRWRSADVWLLILSLAYFCCLSAGPEVYSRFRVPIMPILCVLASLAPLPGSHNTEPPASD